MKTNKIKLTVLMPSYNKEEYIEKAIDSVLNQKTDFEFKLVVTDDGSTDKTIEIVKNYINQYPDKVILLPSDHNQGLLSNIIKAYEYLIDNKSEYFCCLDADDYYIDNLFYKKAIDFLDKNEEFNIYAANTSVLFNDGQIYVQNQHVQDSFVDSTFSDLLNEKAILGNTISSIFRNCRVDENLIKTLKLHVGNHYQEHSFREDDFRNRIHLENSKAHYVNEVIGIYRTTQSGMYQGSNQLKKRLLKLTAFIDMYYFFNKKYPEFISNLSPQYLQLMNNEVLKGDINNVFKYPMEEIGQFFIVLNSIYSIDSNVFEKFIRRVMDSFKNIK